jgi:hypothetical protein
MRRPVFLATFFVLAGLSLSRPAAAQSAAGFVTSQMGDGGGREAEQLDCPAGQLLTGLRVRAGEWISHLTLSCVQDCRMSGSLWRHDTRTPV